MNRLVVTSAAETDFTEALIWYSDRSDQAAERFNSEFDYVLSLIAANPQQFPLCDDRHRFCLMRGFPYQVIYREHGEQLFVIAVAHAKRKPGFWKGR